MTLAEITHTRDITSKITPTCGYRDYVTLTKISHTRDITSKITPTNEYRRLHDIDKDKSYKGHNQQNNTYLWI